MCVACQTIQRVCDRGWFRGGYRRLRVLAPLPVEKRGLFSSPGIWPRERRGRTLRACHRGTFICSFCLSSRWTPLLGLGPRVPWPLWSSREGGPCCRCASKVTPGREPSEPRLVPAAQGPEQMNGCCLKPPVRGAVCPSAMDKPKSHPAGPVCSSRLGHCPSPGMTFSERSGTVSVIEV